MAFLRLHHGYNLPHKPNKKLSNQRAGPFLIKRRVGNLAYELDLPPAWKIHPVISIAQLEPANNSSDPYMRPRPTNPGAVEMAKESDTYEVEKVIKSRIRRYGKKAVTQYLLQWRGYGPEHDEWRNEDECSDCISAVNEFLAKEDTSPPPVLKKSRAILRPSLRNANQDPKLLPTTTTNQKASLVGNKKRLIDPELMSAENVIRMHSTDSLMPEQEGPSITPSQATTTI